MTPPTTVARVWAIRQQIDTLRYDERAPGDYFSRLTALERQLRIAHRAMWAAGKWQNRLQGTTGPGCRACATGTGHHACGLGRLQKMLRI
jgi:hypothetical protein